MDIQSGGGVGEIKFKVIFVQEKKGTLPIHDQLF